MSGDKDSNAGPAGDCPLSHGDQTRNVILFSLNKSLIYLGAPVIYVGITQTALCRHLVESATIANLPATFYAAMTPFSILVAWYFCSARMLKPVLVATYLAIAAGSAVVAALLLGKVPAPILIVAVVMHAAILGCGLAVVTPFEWEVLAKGVSESRRGAALALAFGAGPFWAFLSSLASQLVLDGKVALLNLSIEIPPLGYPLNFAILYAATVPMMIVGAVSASRFVLPPPTSDPPRAPFVEGVFGGFLDFFRTPSVLVVSLATIAVAAGFYILSNLSLFTEVALGEEPKKYAGYQNALRFGFKIIAGLLLGWLLVRTHPKAGLLVTGTLCLAGVLWAMLVPGLWFLLAFGLMGAGELYGVYYPNYVLCCSPKQHIRRNMAFARMLYLPAALAPVLYGSIKDWVGRETGNMRLGFQVSFVVSIAFLCVSLLLALSLPARPRPPE